MKYGMDLRNVGSIYTGKGLARKQAEPIGTRVTYLPVTFMWVVTLHSLFLYPAPTLPCQPLSYWLRLFSSKTFYRINTPTFLKSNHSSYLSAYDDGTVFRNVGI